MIVDSNRRFSFSGGSIQRDIRRTYKFQKSIGEGQFGSVRLAYNKNKDSVNSSKFAIKSISKKNLSYDTIENMINEVEILSQLNHQSIVKFYESYNDDYYFHIVMEEVKGEDIFNYIMKNGSFTEDTSIKIIYKVLKALNYCHIKGISHRDIKAENILIESINENEINVKIIDFGFSKKSVDSKLNTILGSPFYISPEVLNGCYDLRCDIWSIGILFYIMLTGEAPFTGKSNQVIFNKIINSEVNFENGPISDKSVKVKDFIKKCLIKDYNERPSAADLLKHELFSKSDNLNNNFHTNMIQCLKNMLNFKNESLFERFILKYIQYDLLSKEKLNELSSIFEYLDISNNGYLSREEIENWVFICLDKLDKKERKDLIGDEFEKINEKMKIDIDEYSLLTSTYKASEYESNDKKDLLDINNKNIIKYLTNKILLKSSTSKGIDYSDFLIMSIEYKKVLSEEFLNNLFTYFDIDQDEIININDIELSLLRCGMRPLDDMELFDILSEVTKAKADNISKKDFIELFLCREINC